MSTLSYLDNLNSKLVIKDAEKTGISISIGFLKRLFLNSNLAQDIQEIKVFGSFDRETILPRWADKNSDVDIMIVFNNDRNYQPQTLLTKLRGFVQEKYPTSYCHQDFPTVALEMNHIKFELVPAIKPWGYQIAIKGNNYTSWQSTEPFGLKRLITGVNVTNKNIRPLIRLMKYWNANNSKPFASYELEQRIANQAYMIYGNLEDMFYSCVNTLYANYFIPQYKKNAINQLKRKVSLVREYKMVGQEQSAENILHSIFE